MKLQKNIEKLLSCSYFKVNIHFLNFTDERELKSCLKTIPWFKKTFSEIWIEIESIRIVEFSYKSFG